MLRFHDKDDFFELDVASQEEAELPSKGDAYVTIRVSSAGFSGHNDLWVLRDCLKSFCDSLVALEKTRRGNASIQSIFPDELKLRIRSVDSKGHMAIEGSMGFEVKAENSMCWHAVHFGFEFDSSQLVAAAELDWVVRNTG